MKTARRTESGQIVLALVFLLVGLVFLFLAEVDIFSAARGKTRLQNAGDAAALAAASWQGATLNLVGELNLLRLAAACDPDREAATNAVAGICALQERLAVAGPCMALLAANGAARENLEPHLPNDTRHLAAYQAMADMGAAVLTFARSADQREGGTRNWPTKNADYAEMLRAALAGGCWAGADNAAILPAVVTTGAHPLYSKAFYEAADAGNWPRICMNVFGGRHGEAAAALLNWPGWGTVPEATTVFDWDNPEFYGVYLRRAEAGAVESGPLGKILAVADGLGLGGAVDEARVRRYDAFHFPVFADGTPEEERFDARWWFLSPERWRAWHEVDPGGETRFPLRSRVKDEYNVKGAAAAARVVNVLVPVSDAARTNLFAWTAAARPFGSWQGERADAFPLSGTGGAGGEDALSLAMPVFTKARLIPLGGIGENELGAADLDWLTHVRVHVPGGVHVRGCRYCGILDKWDDAAYRRAGGTYLMNHGHDEVCAPPAHGGERPGGGTRHAH